MLSNHRKVERIKEITAEIERVWSIYPDLRLGQLLIVVSLKADLFNIEDDELLERLKNFNI